MTTGLLQENDSALCVDVELWLGLAIWGGEGGLFGTVDTSAEQGAEMELSPEREWSEEWEVRLNDRRDRREDKIGWPRYGSSSWVVSNVSS